jgi:hypothetical protein
MSKIPICYQQSFRRQRFVCKKERYLTNSNCLCLALSVSVPVSVCIYVCLCLSTWLCLSAWYVCLSVFLSVSVCLRLSLSISVCLCVSMSVYVSVCLPGYACLRLRDGNNKSVDLWYKEAQKRKPPPRLRNVKLT